MALYRAKTERQGHMLLLRAGDGCRAADAPDARTRHAPGDHRARVRDRTISHWCTSASRAVSGFEALIRWNHPTPGHRSSQRVHSDRRRDRTDRAAGPVDPAPGLPGRDGMAGQHQGRGQPVVGAVPRSPSGRDRAGRARPDRPAGTPARTGNHRDRAAARQRGDARHTASVARARVSASRWTISAPAIRR